MKWLAERQDKLLPVPHFQVVFTLPSELRALAQAAPAVVYSLLMSSAVKSLQSVLTTQYGARFAVTAVLHTWTRELLLHPHVHIMVSAGGLSLDDTSWVPTGEDFLVSTRKLAPLFRGRMLSGLRAAIRIGELDLVEPLASRREPLLQAAASKTWVVHVEPPKKRSPGVIMKYLARYLFRVAIDDRRLLAHEGGMVCSASTTSRHWRQLHFGIGLTRSGAPREPRLSMSRLLLWLWSVWAGGAALARQAVQTLGSSPWSACLDRSRSRARPARSGAGGLGGTCPRGRRTWSWSGAAELARQAVHGPAEPGSVAPCTARLRRC